MSKLPSAIIPGTEVHLLKSEEIDKAFKISIALPPSYASEPEKLYPAVYLLDADAYFGMVTEMARIMPYCGSVAEAIVVGIGYPLEGILPVEGFRLRARDLTPVKDIDQERRLNEQCGRDDAETGGGALFLRFIKGQLLGFVVTKYRYEKSFAEENDNLPVQLFLAAAMEEEDAGHNMTSNLIKMAAQIKSREYKGLTLYQKLFEDCDHCGAVAPEFQSGLQMVLSTG